MFFFRKKASGKEAKSRLSEVIKCDRINTSQGMWAEKMRKDLASVLSKYTDDSSYVPDIKISYINASECILAARMPIRKSDTL